MKINEYMNALENRFCGAYWSMVWDGDWTAFSNVFIYL
jgi:hypothetical protein